MRYATRVVVPKGAVVRRDDLLALLGLAESLVGATSRITWTLTTGLSEVAGESLDELTGTLGRATANPSAFYASVFDGGVRQQSAERPTINVDLRSKDSRLEIVGDDGEWTARAARDLRVEMAERGVRSPWPRRSTFITAAVVVGFSLFGLYIASGPRTDGTPPMLAALAPYSGAIAAAAGLALAVVLVSVGSPGSAKLSVVRSGGAASWLDATFIRGMLAMATLIGLAWTMYQAITTFVGSK